MWYSLCFSFFWDFPGSVLEHLLLVLDIQSCLYKFPDQTYGHHSPCLKKNEEKNHVTKTAYRAKISTLPSLRTKRSNRGSSSDPSTSPVTNQAQVVQRPPSPCRASLKTLRQRDKT